MPAVHDRLHGRVLSELAKGVWVLRAGAFAEADGSVVLLLAVGGRGLDQLVVDLTADPGYVSTDLIGIDAAGGVLAVRGSHSDGVDIVPHPERRSAGSLPATLRVKRVIFLHDAVGERSPSTAAAARESVLGSLVAASIDLHDLARPLARIVQLVDACGVAHLDITSAVTVAELRAAAPPPPGPQDREKTAPRASTQRDRRHDPADGPSTARRYFRGTALDSVVLAENGHLAVLLNQGAAARLDVLSPSDAEVWNRADGVDKPALGGSDAQIDALFAAGLLGDVPSWRIAADVAWVADHQRTTVLGPWDDASPLGLEASAHAVWALLDERGSVRQDDLIERCAEYFGTGAREISAPIESLLRDLWSRGLIVRI